MSKHSYHTRFSGHRDRSLGGGPFRAGAAQPLLVTATDVSLWLTLMGVTVCFGGRAAIGQLILVIGAVLTAGCWLLHQWTSREPAYTWTGSEWLWVAGIAIGVCQLVPLPREALLAVSPAIGRILIAADGDAAAAAVAESRDWNQLSLAPWETASGLATLAAYGLLFIVIVQRLKTTADVERMLLGVGVICIAMAAFAQVQYLTSNGRFYWFLLHPFTTTDRYPTGCFTTRNHLAQFLALGVGPLIWCLLRRLEADPVTQSNSQRHPASRHPWVTLALFLGLCGTVLTALATLSRGGLLAVSVAIAVSVVTLWRLGRVSATLCLGLVIAAVAVGAVFNLTGNEMSLAARIGSASGRDQVWRANLAVASDFPILGTGVGTHADAHQLHLDRPQDGREFTHAESGYLQILSETGGVGLGLAVLFIVTALWWCIRALRHPDARASSIAAVVLASLIANLAQATCDFFWYTPSCVLLLAMQLACVCRLSRPTRDQVRGVVASRQVSPWLIWPVAGGVLAAGAAMCAVKLPAALAEPDQMRSLALHAVGSESFADDEDRHAAQHEKRQAILQAARLDPHDSRLQELAGYTYLDWFHERQQQSENALSLAHVSDAVRASGFESQAELDEWLSRSVGKNGKLLRVAQRSLRRALRLSPLRARSLAGLAELSFLETGSEAAEALYLQRALAIRPHDPEILLAAGRHDLRVHGLDQALVHWRVAFALSPRLQPVIAGLLASEMTPEFCRDQLQPDWAATGVLATAFQKAGREEAAHEMWADYITAGLQRLKTRLTEAEYQEVVLGLRAAHHTRQEPDRAIRVLTHGAKRLPHSLPLRLALGHDLEAEQRLVEAAEHLEWCAARLPHDRSVQQAAARAVKERLRQPTSRPTHASDGVQPKTVQ